MSATKRTCDTCGHSWLDKYHKDECPKCLQPLSSPEGMKRAPGEASTYKEAAGSAMESASGECPKGGMHTWKFGKCSKCGRGEGAEAADKLQGGECSKGGKHIFKFGKCSKCGAFEGGAPPKAKVYADAFALFDTDSSGTISADELKAALCRPASADYMTVEEAEAFMDKYDINHDGAPMPVEPTRALPRTLGIC